jgi:hypothetical protein
MSCAGLGDRFLEKNSTSFFIRNFVIRQAESLCKNGQIQVQNDLFLGKSRNHNLYHYFLVKNTNLAKTVKFYNHELCHFFIIFEKKSHFRVFGEKSESAI